MINAERQPRDVILIGASAGGVEALRSLFAQFPHDLPAHVFVVLHRSPLHQSQLAWVLSRGSSLPVFEAADGIVPQRGHIYVAPRDRHLVVNNGHLQLSRGAKEHRTRPAIDPLFRSAAHTYGPRVVGVLLSGSGDDGVSGLIDIKNAGGLSLVQHPSEALHPSMPRTAIEEDDVDGVLVLRDLAAALTALAEADVFEIKPPEAQTAS